MKKGFTLIEMLVVIGIIAVLIGASFGSYNAFIKKAARSRCVELVANARTALEAVYLKEGAWPRPVLAGAGEGVMKSEVGAALAKRNALSLTWRTTEIDGESVYELTGNDRLGVVSPWATDVIRRKQSVNEGTKVPSGGTIADHRLRYAIDTDEDGITEVTDKSVRVRATACVWCCGADGKFGTKDDVNSWTPEQEVK